MKVRSQGLGLLGFIPSLSFLIVALLGSMLLKASIPDTLWIGIVLAVILILPFPFVLASQIKLNKIQNFSLEFTDYEMIYKDTRYIKYFEIKKIICLKYREKSYRRHSAPSYKTLPIRKIILSDNSSIEFSLGDLTLEQKDYIDNIFHTKTTAQIDFSK